MSALFGWSRETLRSALHAGYRGWLTARRVVKEQLNRNIYTRIVLTNVMVFAIGLLALLLLSTFVVRQISNDQVQQELLRKAKRVNFALLQQEGKDQLRFLADAFDARITVFDMEGNIAATSAETEVVPGSKVALEYVATIGRGETATRRSFDRQTGSLIFSALVPMGNDNDVIQSGILLETSQPSLDIALSRMRLYLLSGGMAILVMIIVVSVYLAMYISRPLSRLATAVAEVSKGNDVFDVETQPLDEINVLTAQLSKLVVKLQGMRVESRRMEEERARLFAEISHELRTPLTAVQGFVEAIRDGMVQDETLRKRYLDTILAQTVHITRLVDDVLALSRLESGSTSVDRLPVDLNALAKGVAMSMETMATGRNTAIVLGDMAERAVVLGDADRMEQIIKNLVKNAIQATENGTVRISSEARQGEVVLTIEDNGIGIAPEDLPHIWDRFYQVKNHRGSHFKEKGSGLGLVIVKRLVQLQDGKIDVASQPGKGTAFRISFPSLE